MKKKKYLKSATLCLLFSALLAGCSGDKEEKEPGAIEQVTDKAAEVGIEYIQQPIEKAQGVQDIQDAHAQKMKEAMGESDQ